MVNPNRKDWNTCLDDALWAYRTAYKIPIGFLGYPFTWSNHHAFPHTVQERLDRACANSRASQRFQTSLITRIKNASREWVENTDDIQQCIISYFRGVFASIHPRGSDIASGMDHLRHVVNTCMAEDLLQPYIETETVFSAASCIPITFLMATYLQQLSSVIHPLLGIVSWLHISFFCVGYRWWVGNGGSIHVWANLWLPRLVSFRPIPSPIASLENLRVSDLIDQENGDWNSMLIQDTFLHIDRDVILEIPLIICWNWSIVGGGDFGRLIFQQSEGVRLVCVFECPSDRPNLNRRILDLRSICPICLGEGEHAMHFLALYYFARQLGRQAVGKRTLLSPLREHRSSTGNAHLKLNFDGALLNHGIAIGLRVVARDA
ncbi:hypothetical protein Sango_1178200 [Sesamum angolense]|uniref:Uncharacterized protein n=1 Tax=Sesamum angolense TaxID=2727404 RepID=A0AAE1WWK6_9LAMI|nr:hypothetical protein Sango_1178200 [Sesamum angolense]